MLREAGLRGILPSKIAYQLRTYSIDRFRVTHSIKAKNRRLQRELGYDTAEKAGHKWVLTAFVDDIWGATEGEIEERYS